MTYQLVFNLALLVLVGALLMWFPDRLTLIPLVLSKVAPAADTYQPSEPIRPRPRKPRRPGAAARAKKKPRKKRDKTRR